MGGRRKWEGDANGRATLLRSRSSRTRHWKTRLGRSLALPTAPPDVAAILFVS